MPIDQDESLEISIITEAVQSFEALKKKYEKPLEIRIKAKSKIEFDLIGLGKEKELERITKKSSKLAWQLFWSGFEKVISSEKTFDQWLVETATNNILVLKLKEGDFSVLEKIKLKYWNQVFFFVRKLMSVNDCEIYNSSKAEEISENAFFRMRDNIEKFNPFIASFYTWLLKITENLTKDSFSDNKEILVQSFNGDDLDEDEKKGFLTLKDEALSPMENENREWLGKFFLKTLFSSGGYPWQILSVALIKCDVDRKLIVGKLAELSINKLFNLVVDEFSKASIFPPEEIKPIFDKFEMILSLSVKEIIGSGDSRSIEYLSNIAEKTSGDTFLKDYFGKDSLKSLRDWNHRVFKRIKREAFKQGLFE